MQNWIWILIPLAGIFAGVVMRWLRIKERQLESVRAQSDETVSRYAAQTDRLEQRMRVLERIITDKGFDVAEEIEHLRHAPPARSREGSEVE
jgi:hypothetical protein